LNGFWDDGVDSQVANRVWDLIKKFVELDLMGGTRKGEEGNELDQFWSAKFLEDMDTALPAIQRKEALRNIDHDHNGKMSAIEYLVWKYKKTIEETVVAPQGDNTAAIKAAQAVLDQVLAQLADCERKLAHQKEIKAANEKAISEVRSAEAAVDAARKELVKAEEELSRAESELANAVKDLEDQQNEYQNKCSTLERTSKDTGLSQVQRSKAANELAQLKTEDPLPLRKSKITQEAALRKVQKQKKATEEARLQTEAKQRDLESKRADLEAKGRELERAIEELEEAYVQLEVKMKEAEDQLELIKNKPGGGKGALWWLQRELFEVDKRLPTAKQKFNHNQPFNYSP